MSAEEAARHILRAADEIRQAIAILEAEHLELTNYPENWHDFTEHPGELEGIMVSAPAHTITVGDLKRETA